MPYRPNRSGPSAHDHRVSTATDPPAPPDLTALLQRAGHGDRAAMNAVAPLVYERLRALARRELSGDRALTLSTTALVHEAWLDLSAGKAPDFRDRAHFYRYAATAMRHILVDHARQRHARKRGGGIEHIALDGVDAGADPAIVELIAIDAAIDALSQVNPRLTEVVELRCFAGLDVEETARVLDRHPRSVVRDWRRARALLHDMLVAP